MTLNGDRVVHGHDSEGAEIVRYDRAGKWYIEPKGGKRRKVTLDEAAHAAVAGTTSGNRYGGARFDARVSEIRKGL